MMQRAGASIGRLTVTMGLCTLSRREDFARHGIAGKEYAEYVCGS